MSTTLLPGDAGIVVTAPAKVNLALHVSPRRPDGYHNLKTVFMAVSLYDEMRCAPLPDGRIEVAVSGPQAELVPVGNDLAGRAAALLRRRHGQPSLGVRLDIAKAIPVAGGMAGGSADAAAALRVCNQLWELGAGDDELLALAAELGADVPFALLGGVALGTGRGDILTPLPSAGVFHWVFALASEGLSTAAVFQAFDARPAPGPAAPLDDLLAGLAAGDAAQVGAALANDLCPAAVGLRPELAETLATGRACDGVLGAVLAGSGPTCAFLCASAAAASATAATLAGLPQVAGTCVASGPVPGPRIATG